MWWTWTEIKISFLIYHTRNIWPGMHSYSKHVLTYNGICGDDIKRCSQNYSSEILFNAIKIVQTDWTKQIC